MAEIVDLFTLRVNVDDAVKESVRLQNQITSLRKSQQDLDRTTEEGAAAYLKLDAQLKNSTKSLRDNQKLVAAVEAANEDLNKTLAVEGKTRQELYDSRNKLNEIAKSLNATNAEDAELLAKINKTIDEQTAAIRANASEFNASKDQVGEYKDNILKAYDALKQQQSQLRATEAELSANLATLEQGTDEYKQYSAALSTVQKDLDGVNAQLGENTTETKSASLSAEGLFESLKDGGSATEYLSGGLSAAKTGMKSLTKAALTFIATPIGIVLAAIVGAFLLVKNAMDRNEETANKVQKAFAGFSGIAKMILRVLEPVGEFLIDGLVKGFELVEKAITATVSGIGSALEFLGLDDAGKGFKDFAAEMEGASENAKALTAAELDLTKAQREARKVQLEFQKDAEKLRQIRDDETKSFKERIAANDQLSATLEKQSEVELGIAQKAIDFANKRIELEGETTEALDARAAAETEFADIQERITGQTSEQLVNRVSLQKEAAEKAFEIQRAAAEKAISELNNELDAYISVQGVRAKTLEDQLAYEVEVSEKRKEILEAELAAGIISQSEYNLQIVQMESEMLRTKAELVAENAAAELQTYIDTNQSKIDDERYLSDEMVAIETERLERLAEKRREYEALRLEEGIISETEYNAAINAINAENFAANEELRMQREEAEKERAAVDAANRLELLSLQGGQEFALKLAELEQNRLAEIAAAERTGADINLINEKYNKQKEALDAEVRDSQIAGFGSVFDSFASLLGEQTAAGKAAAVASTVISTYQGAQQAFTSLSGIPVVGPALGIAAATAAVVAGVQRVRQITATPTEFADGGVLVGASHANGGIPFTINGVGGFEAEGGEAIINKRSTALYRPLLSAINTAGGGRKFAAGGLVGSSSTPSPNLINYDILAARMGQEMAKVQPVVSVVDITSATSRVNVVENIARM